MIYNLDSNKNYVMDIQFKYESYRETVIGSNFPTNFLNNNFISYWYDDNNGFELFFVPIDKVEYFTIYEK